jgi:hypothetical protein
MYSYAKSLNKTKAQNTSSTLTSIKSHFSDILGFIYKGKRGIAILGNTHLRPKWGGGELVKLPLPTIASTH